MATNVENAIAIGKKNAEARLARRKDARERRARALAPHPAKLALGVTAAAPAAPVMARETAGFLLAMGDSWFDYPFYDVLKLLEDNYGYDVESTAHRGDPLEAIAYGGQLDKLGRCFEKVTERGGTPKAVLVSGGGDQRAFHGVGCEFRQCADRGFEKHAVCGSDQQCVSGLVGERTASDR